MNLQHGSRRAQGSYDGQGTDPGVLAAFPRIAALVARFQALPAVKQWNSKAAGAK